MLTPIYLFLVTGITAGEAPTHWFLPIDGEWQERVAGLFGNALPERNLFSNRSTPELMQNRHPLCLVNPEGDGACLPRALSLAIWGTQDNHQLLRDAVVDRMLEGPLPGDSRPQGEEFLQRMEQMRNYREYMGTEEIEAFAYLLQTPIFSCVKVECAKGSRSTQHV